MPIAARRCLLTVVLLPALLGVRPALADARAQGEVFTASERILQVMDGVTGQYARL